MFELHTGASAPVGSADPLRRIRSTLGFVPGVFGVLAEVPAALAAYEHLYGVFQRNTAFSPVDRRIVMVTASRANACVYCMVAHSMMMASAKMPAEHIAARRDGATLADPKLEALRSYGAQLLTTRGHLDAEHTAAFLAAGYTQAQALEILIGLAAKLIANFAASLADLDPEDAAAAFT